MRVAEDPVNCFVVFHSQACLIQGMARPWPGKQKSPPRAAYRTRWLWSFHFMPAVLQSCLVSGWGPV